MQLYVYFLGTGGSWPTIQRNVSSIAIKRGREVLLFDCGEGTQRQIQKSNLSYMQITKIFITHFHGDHFLGLPGLIQTMQLNDREQPLYIYGPRRTEKLVNEILRLGYFNPSYDIIVHEIKDGEEIGFDGYVIRTAEVCHNVPTLAYAFEEDMRPGRFNKKKALELGVPEGPLFRMLQNGQDVEINGRKITPDMVLGKPRPGRKIVYSGDTRPCESVIKLSENGDLLIHDATFDSTLEKRAAEYGHSTAKQAAEIALKSRVKRLALTHISPRYNDDKMLEEEAKAIFLESFVAKDFYKLEIKMHK